MRRSPRGREACSAGSPRSQAKTLSRPDAPAADGAGRIGIGRTHPSERANRHRAATRSAAAAVAPARPPTLSRSGETGTVGSEAPGRAGTRRGVAAGRPQQRGAPRHRAAPPPSPTERCAPPGTAGDRRRSSDCSDGVRRCNDGARRPQRRRRSRGSPAAMTPASRWRSPRGVRAANSPAISGRSERGQVPACVREHHRLTITASAGARARARRTAAPESAKRDTALLRQGTIAKSAAPGGERQESGARTSPRSVAINQQGSARLRAAPRARQAAGPQFAVCQACRPQGPA